MLLYEAKLILKEGKLSRIITLSKNAKEFAVNALGGDKAKIQQLRDTIIKTEKEIEKRKNFTPSRSLQRKKMSLEKKYNDLKFSDAINDNTWNATVKRKKELRDKITELEIKANRKTKSTISRGINSDRDLDWQRRVADSELTKMQSDVRNARNRAAVGATSLLAAGSTAYGISKARQKPKTRLEKLKDKLA